MSAADEYRLQAELLQMDVLKFKARIAELEAELTELRPLKPLELGGPRVRHSRRQLSARIEELSERLSDQEVGDVVFLFVGRIVEVAQTIQSVRERRKR